MCPVLLRCVELRIQTNIQNARDGERRIFPVLAERAEHDVDSLPGTYRSMSAVQREFVDQSIASAACLDEEERAAIAKAKQKVHGRKHDTPTQPHVFPETDLATLLKEVPPETFLQRMIRSIQTKVRGMKEPLGRHP